MEVTTNKEISYSLRLTTTEAHKLHKVLMKVANSNSCLFVGSDQCLCKELAICIKDEVDASEGINL